MVSAPFFFKNAAASKVLTPVFIMKFFVSSIIPASRASAAWTVMLESSPKYSIRAVTSSQADDAFGSKNDMIVGSIPFTILLWWSITTTFFALASISFDSTSAGLWVSVTTRSVLSSSLSRPS